MFRKGTFKKYPDNIRIHSIQNYFQDARQEALDVSIKLQEEENKPEETEEVFKVSIGHFKSCPGWLKIIEMVRFTYCILYLLFYLQI